MNKNKMNQQSKQQYGTLTAAMDANADYSQQAQQGQQAQQSAQAKASQSATGKAAKSMTSQYGANQKTQ